MVLPMAEALTTPSLTSRMSPSAREKLKDQYRRAKKYGLKAAWGVIAGAGVLELAKDVVQGELINQGKNRVRSLIILGCNHIGFGLVPVMTNSTKVIKYVKKYIVLRPAFIERLMRPQKCL